MADTANWTEEKFRVGEAELQVIKGGSGKPLLVFHGELGDPGWLTWHSALAAERTLWIPQHPGFGKSPYVDWIMDMRDLGAFYARFAREQNLAPVDVIGFSLGGWLAAEMAAQNVHQFNKMILVAAAGLRTICSVRRSVHGGPPPTSLGGFTRGLSYRNEEELCHGAHQTNHGDYHVTHH